MENISKTDCEYGYQYGYRVNTLLGVFDCGTDFANAKAMAEYYKQMGIAATIETYKIV